MDDRAHAAGGAAPLGWPGPGAATAAGPLTPDEWDRLPGGILWTVMPLVQVLHGWGGEQPPQPVTGPGGVMLLVRPGPGGAVIERVLSTCPSDYLRPELAPGRRLPGW